jgi:adenine-specific DNA-methyltransferase
MDEIFGIENFRNDITRIKCNPRNFGRRAYGNVKDLILFYTKSDDYIWNEPKQQRADDEIKRLFKMVDANGRHYTTNPLHAPGETRNGDTFQNGRLCGLKS